MPKNKTDNFLKAIKNYARRQKSQMQGEVKQLKAERLREAEERAKRDSQRLVKEKMNESRSRFTAQLAAATQDGRRRLFLERKEMTEGIFKLAAEKLTEYAATEGYSQRLKQDAAGIAALFEGKSFVLYVSERDFDSYPELCSAFGDRCLLKADKTIKIGGVRGYCESMGIIADETLDSKLEQQRGWFAENAALSVL